MSRPSLSRRTSSKPSPAPSQSRQSAGVAASPLINPRSADAHAPPLPRRAPSIAAAAPPALQDVASTPTGAAAMVSPRRPAHGGAHSEQTLPPFGTNGFLNFSTFGAYLFAMDDTAAVPPASVGSAVAVELSGAAAAEVDARHRPLVVRALAQGVAPDIVFVQCVRVAHTFYAWMHW